MTLRLSVKPAAAGDAVPRWDVSPKPLTEH